MNFEVTVIRKIPYFLIIFTNIKHTCVYYHTRVRVFFYVSYDIMRFVGYYYLLELIHVLLNKGVAFLATLCSSRINVTHLKEKYIVCLTSYMRRLVSSYQAKVKSKR